MPASYHRAVILPGFEHGVGVHCGSTAMLDALRFAGVTLSEPMVFGLGLGCSFTIHRGNQQLQPPQPTLLFAGRSMSFEEQLCAALLLDASVAKPATAAEAWSAAKALLDEGRPALVTTDLFHLPYLGARGHWGGHLVVLVGHEAGFAFVADNERPALERVTEAELLLALEGLAEPAAGLSVVGSVRPRMPLKSGDLLLAAELAIGSQARLMLSGSDQPEGLSVLEQFPAELRALADRPDWQKCLRLGFQIIELRGNGGGLFRRLYGRFLTEVSRLGLSQAGELRTPTLAAADAWTALAQAMETARHRDRPELAEVVRLAEACVEAERTLWTRAAALFV